MIQLSGSPSTSPLTSCDAILGGSGPENTQAGNYRLELGALVGPEGSRLSGFPAPKLLYIPQNKVKLRILLSFPVSDFVNRSIQRIETSKTQ